MKLKKIKLNQLENTDLNEHEMIRILGGYDAGSCQCGCYYAGSGGSSTNDNGSANAAGGYTSVVDLPPVYVVSGTCTKGC